MVLAALTGLWGTLERPEWVLDMGLSVSAAHWPMSHLLVGEASGDWGWGRGSERLNSWFALFLLRPM